MFMKFSWLLLSLFLFKNVLAQNLGIGTTMPTRAQLEVVGVSGSGNTAAIFGDGSTGISFQQNWGSVGFNQYRDAAGGNGKYMSNGFAALWYQDPNTGSIAIDLMGTGTGGTTTLNPVRGLTVLSNGQVGIQTPTPTAGLAVGRGTGIDGTAVFAGSQHWSHFNYADAEHTYIRSGRDGGILYINTIPNGNVFFGSGASRVMIGASSFEPTATIHISGVATAFFALWNEYNHKWDMRLDYIDVSTPSYDLEFFYNNVRKTSFHFNSGLMVAVSDKNAKDDIQKLDPVLTKVGLLKPVSYEVTDHNPTHKRSLGFIAQDMKAVFPQLVQVLDDQPMRGVHHKDLHTMNYSAINVIAIKALQEQNEQLRKLQEERELLMKELRRLADELGL